ncbi:S8 family peptidase [Frigoriglobus tundricola]|uniref:Peptidase S8/S53 domain-containing protein n=1 Tax=Frigoriglobus tundricola TaxID=2774151 RepID=A0A6M5YZB2_9BACT|nr:S8 family serine peptidase [Frigoriglobus tundricola]QJW98796.1 hypothetical protein FTUN_6391 [Frigoriglobus tundricola]
MGRSRPLKGHPLENSPENEPVAPWGEEMFPDAPFTGFAASGLFVPRDGHEETDLTFAPTAGIRQSAVTGKKVYVAKPSKDADQTLQRIGLTSTRFPHRLSELKAKRAGLFTPLEALGMSAAFFHDEKERDDALSELNGQYEFVADFPLSLPCRVTMRASPASRRAAQTAREWPTQSGVAAAHAAGVRGKDVLIAVLDTGADADHAEFAGRRITYRYISFFPNNPNWPPRDVRGFDTNGHGTHVSGILVGQTVGVAPEADLYVASVIESETILTSVTRVFAGLQWVLRHFTTPNNERKPGVLNMSLGFPQQVTGVDANELQARFRTMQLFLTTLRRANVLPVAAIGNAGAGQFGYPGAFKEAVGVGAVDFNEQVPGFSGSAPAGNTTPAKPDLAGYGVGVNSAVERDYEGQSIYQRFNGTSMASPYVAGIAALYRSEDPALSVDEVYARLVATARPVAGQKARTGAGIATYVAH